MEDVPKGTFSGFLLRARPKTSEIDTLFSGYRFVTNNIREEIIRRSSITTRALTSGTSLSKVKFNLPSKSEQVKIAQFLMFIDQRIALQRRKVELLKDYKKGLAQHIFDVKRNSIDWEYKPLSEITEQIIRKNIGRKSNRPLTISAQYGIVDQVEFFNKAVASNNTEGYYLLKRGDFAYNKSYSTDYPFGAVKRLDRYDEGVLSSLYICFIPKPNVDSDFLSHYFETCLWHKEISFVAAEGARNHGLLNIAASDFFDTLHRIPKRIVDQELIARILNRISKKIETEQRSLDNMDKFKSGLLQRMFI